MDRVAKIKVTCDDTSDGTGLSTLVDLLIRKGLIGRDEYSEAVAAARRREADRADREWAATYARIEARRAGRSAACRGRRGTHGR